MIDEKSRRKPCFNESRSHPVVLADGQTWWLRKPVFRVVSGDGPGGVEQGLTLPGVDFAAARKRLHEAIELSLRLEGAAEGDAAAEWAAHPDLYLPAAQMELGRCLLGANYDLEPAEYGQLLQFGYDEDEDPEGCAILDAVMGVARGDAPKPKNGGA